MKNFFKPTKVTWWVFGILFALLILLWFGYILLASNLQIDCFIGTGSCTLPKGLTSGLTGVFLASLFSTSFVLYFPTLLLMEEFPWSTPVWMQMVEFFLLTILYYYLIASIVSKIWYAFRGKNFQKEKTLS